MAVDPRDILTVFGSDLEAKKPYPVGTIARSVAYDMSLTIEQCATEGLTVTIPALMFTSQFEKDAAQIVFTWMKEQHGKETMAPVAPAKMVQTTGSVDAEGVLRVYEMLDVFGVKFEGADEAIEEWLLKHIVEVGITAKQIRKVWCTFPLDVFPGNKDQKRDFRPGLLRGLNKVEKEKNASYTDDAELWDLVMRKPDFRVAWEATWRTRPPWHEWNADEKEMGVKREDETSTERKDKPGWWLLHRTE
ncbi:MAG: hypothetical protein INR71_01105 [Terriglobus roseus]|nr:hypothetical protein [Terriglobus roseus]